MSILETLSRTTENPDQEILSLLLRRYKLQLESTTHLVANRLEQAGILPHDGISDLVYRHGLLFFAALDALDCELTGHERIACGAILAYSIPLVWIDSNLDGNVSSLRRGELPWSLVKPHTISLLTHLGYRDMAVGGGSSASIQWISQISSVVIEAMDLDFAKRWDLKQLEAEEATLSQYWESPTSRLNGSGIGSLMIGLASIQADGRVTAERSEIASVLGRLRQVADELMDVGEDVCGGLITLPVLYGLNDEFRRDHLHCVVRKLWTDSSLSKSVREDLVGQLRETLMESDAPIKMTRGADVLLSNALTLLSVSFPKVEPVRALLLHRRFQADRAVKNRLSDPWPKMTVGMLLGNGVPQ